MTEVPPEHPHHLAKKRTIIKDRLGCVRTSTYQLPGDGFTFGRPTEERTETAADVISNWVTTNPSLEKRNERMLVYSNVLAIKRGCITAKSMRQYSIDHPNIRLKEVLQSDSTRVDNKHEGPFGRKTELSKDPMGDILGAKYTNYANDDADYPVITSIKKVGYMPVPRPTIASQAPALAREKALAEQEKSHFTMKKFQNVKSVIGQERELERSRKLEMSQSIGSPTTDER